MTSWFDTARFGLFVHWGHYSAQGIEASWPMVGGVFAVPEAGVVDVAEYQATAKTFDPQRYDPASWARKAKAAGMQYAVFTTKHHDGFAMFDTKTSDHGIMHGPHGRDLFRAFADAMRAGSLAALGMHSSSTIATSAPSASWIAIAPSGVSRRRRPSSGDANATPSSSTFARCSALARTSARSSPIAADVS